MTPQELKNSILQLAIQGKLVEQHPEEGTAEELFAQIQEEKQRLNAEKKIKKEKPLPEITEDEKPFDIPESWKWIHLGELVRVIGGVSYKKGDVSSRGTRILRGGNIQAMKIILAEDDVFLPTAYNDAEKQIRFGDILIVASTGSKTVIGKAAYVDKDYSNTMIGAFLRICRPIFMPAIQYIRYLFDSEFYRKHIRDLSQGTNINNVKEAYITDFVVPLPPLAEQKRIVAKIEELLPYIDRYEQAWSKLEQFNSRFPEDMKKSLLQYAIQGKLVEQRPEEGTADELFAQIQEEKQRLIAEKKIKKETPLPEITEGEKPFDIPESWKWVRLGTVSAVQSSKRVFEKDYVSDGIPFLRSKEIGNLYRGEEIQTQLFITQEHYEQLKKDYGVPQIGDILITSVGTIGNTWICDGREFYYKDGNITQICSNKFMYPRFLQFYIESPLFGEQAHTTVSGTAYNALTIIKLKQMMLPLPPLAEQKRIVEKLEQLLPLCERLK